MKPVLLRVLTLSVTVTGLAACNLNQASPLPPGVSTTPFQAPTPPLTLSPNPSGSPTPSAGVSAGPSLAPGILFRDDFDGDELDPKRWTAYEKGGIVRVKDGVLDVATTGLAPTAPMVLAKSEILPPTGAFYFEMSYTIKSTGRPPSFNLDYLPPIAADDPGLTEPFMSGLAFQGSLAFRFATEAKALAIVPRGNMGVEVPHRLRLECDGNDNFRAIFDTTEHLKFQSRRRPKTFWIGPWPNKPISASQWARCNVDYVEVGKLVEPDPATPIPAPSAVAAAPTATPVVTPP